MSLNSTCTPMYSDICESTDGCYQLACHYSKIPGTSYILYDIVDNCDNVLINIKSTQFGSALVSPLFVNCTIAYPLECSCGKSYPPVKCTGFDSCRNAMCDIFKHYSHNETYPYINFEPLDC
jgi:hypothetical protein